MVYPGILFHRRQRGIPMHSYENRSQIRALARALLYFVMRISDEIEQGASKIKWRQRPRPGSVLAAAGDWRAALNIRRWDIRRVRQPSGAPALSVRGAVQKVFIVCARASSDAFETTATAATGGRESFRNLPRAFHR